MGITLAGGKAARRQGGKKVLVLWLAPPESAQLWLQVVTEWRHRGVQDILTACADGLKACPKTIETVVPRTTTQLRIVQRMRNSLTYLSWKRRPEVAAALRTLHTAATADEAEQGGASSSKAGRGMAADQPVMAA